MKSEFEYREEFEDYLKDLTSSDTYLFNIIDFIRLIYIKWLDFAQITDIVHVRKSDILDYVEYEQLKENPIKLGTINNRLNYLRKYYDFLIHKGLIFTNPVKGIHIGRDTKKIVESPLAEKELHELYEQFVESTTEFEYPINFKKEYVEAIKKRNILVMSLVIYQGLDTGEIDKLHIKDVNFEKGTIYICGAARRNSRYLKLESHQIFQLMKYISSLPDDQEKLIATSMVSQGYKLSKLVRGVNPRAKDLSHIRKSRIMSWLKSYNIREVQYMTGFKFISSLEELLNQDIDDLSIRFNQIHLLG